MLTSTKFIQSLQGRRFGIRRMEIPGGRNCDLCGYSTPKTKNLAAHKKIHTGEKPYQCGSCDYSCTSNKDLKQHSYTHTGEKPFQCGSCDYSCTSAGGLKRHSITHTRKKNY